MANENILWDFEPYIWYDIVKYPTSRRFGHYGSHPRVTIAVKYYDAEADGFRFYKRENAHYTEGSYEHEAGWGTPNGHRAVGFMHDGSDLPLKEEGHSLNGISEPPHFNMMTKSEIRREEERIERERERKRREFSSNPVQLSQEDRAETYYHDKDVLDGTGNISDEV